MRAGGRFFDTFCIVQQALHFIYAQRVAGFDGSLAGHHRQNFLHHIFRIGHIVFGGVGRGVLLGGGRDNTIEGNIFMYLPKGIHVDARGPRGITLDKPGSWNLKAKCEAVGYQSALWKARYPKLAVVLDEQPLLPLGNMMRHNLFIDCKQAFALAKDVKAEWLSRKDNRERKAADYPFLPTSPSAGELDLKTLPKLWENVPGFEPIPFERIGPEGM